MFGLRLTAAGATSLSDRYGRKIGTSPRSNRPANCAHVLMIERMDCYIAGAGRISGLFPQSLMMAAVFQAWGSTSAVVWKLHVQYLVPQMSRPQRAPRLCQMLSWRHSPRAHFALSVVSLFTTAQTTQGCSDVINQVQYADDVPRVVASSSPLSTVPATCGFRAGFFS